jgi:protein-S-isoprenylcysteine O-methyltransferase Ste14
MFVRALAAFVVLPGLFGYVVPVLVVANSSDAGRPNSPGLIVLAMGTLILLWCVIEFYRRGKGTLAPWAPPVHLVTSGLYRYTRNPMYVGVLLVLAGWASAFQSLILLVYAVAVAVGFHLRVIHGEEPALARTFGATWHEYRASVPRWLWPVSSSRRKREHGG